MPCCIHALEMNCCADDHDDIDALFNDETDVQFLESLCSKRLHESKGEFGMLVSDAQNDASDIWGYLSEIGHEKEVLHMSTHSPRLLIHFYNPSFKSCQLLNEHLQKLARKFPATRFIFIEASKAPFLIVKMKIQVLPCLVCIVDSLVVDKLIGFDDLGGNDQFTAKQLEDRLSSHSRIFNVPHRLKKSADRRDSGNSSDSEQEN